MTKVWVMFDKNFWARYCCRRLEPNVNRCFLYSSIVLRFGSIYWRIFDSFWTSFCLESESEAETIDRIKWFMATLSRESDSGKKRTTALTTDRVMILFSKPRANFFSPAHFRKKSYNQVGSWKTKRIDVPILIASLTRERFVLLARREFNGVKPNQRVTLLWWILTRKLN